MDTTKSMLNDMERRNKNNELAKSILGLTNLNYQPNNTGWLKYKGNLVVKSNEGYKYV